MNISPNGDCPGYPHGPMKDWDVSGVTDMSQMFYIAFDFNQDLSKWDVSKVTKFSYMFSCASSFNQDLSKWDVTAAIDMEVMFAGASSFNQDLSKWDVSAVTDMESMFLRASAFNRQLCGVAWVNSKADKSDMFKDSTGSISSTVCTTATNDHGGDYG